MADDHEDYETGAAPAAHKVSHQDGGTDQISVAGLAGVTAELAVHALIATAHQDAPALIETHRLVAGAHHARYTDAEATIIANAQIGIHAAIPTAHQNAPALIETHRLVAGAHHAKYTDAEARASFNPISFSPVDFVPHFDTYDFDSDPYQLHNRTSLTVQYFYTSVRLPNGCTVTKLTLYGWRDDGAAVMRLYLDRTTHTGILSNLGGVVANWVGGAGSLYDDIINNAVIDNNTYQYALTLWLDPNDAVTDVKFFGAKIEFTG